METARVVRVGFAALVLVGCGREASDITLRTVPTPPAYVSGGETLVSIEAAPGVDLTSLSVSVAGTPAEHMAPAPADRLGRERNAVLALVTGLSLGDNEVVASLGGEEVASLTVTNWPIEGPIFSGEHLEPCLCLAELAPTNGRPSVFALGNGQALDGKDFDAACAMETRIDVVYRTAGEPGQWKPLLSSSPLPDDVSQATTSEGKTVPFVVRLETGTIDRAI
jgi:hypothetical protein